MGSEELMPGQLGCLCLAMGRHLTSARGVDRAGGIGVHLSYAVGPWLALPAPKEIKLLGSRNAARKLKV